MNNPTFRLRAVPEPHTAERPAAYLALDGFLDRYNGRTRGHYEVVLGVLFEWCEGRGRDALAMRRSDLEQFARYLENARGCVPSTVANYLSVVKGYYKYAFVDDFIPKSPAEYLRIPKHYSNDAKRTWLNRYEYSALRKAAQESHPAEWALVTMLGMLGLRISEALSVQIEDFVDIERGHRVLRIVGKGSKAATMPLPVMVQRAMDAAAGDRESGQLLLRPVNGEPMNRRSAAIAITRLAQQCGIETNVTPHSLRRTYITEGFASGVTVRQMQKAARHADPRQTMIYDRREDDHDSHANYVVANFMASAA